MSGPLKHPKHEILAQERAKGTQRAIAFDKAGYAPKSGGGARAWLGKSVKARAAELQAKAAAKAVKIFDNVENALAVTSAALIQRAEAARQLAMELDNPAAAVSAIHVMAKLAGVWIDKRETTNRNVDQLTDDELASYLIRGSGSPLIEAKADQGELN
jgi:hypothetical protein